MVRGIEGNEMSTPRASSQKKMKQTPSGSQSTKSQRSILGFFQKKTVDTSSPARSDATLGQQTPLSTITKKSSGPPLTPQPSSDPVQPSSPIRLERVVSLGKNKENGLSLPYSLCDMEADHIRQRLQVSLLEAVHPERYPLPYPHAQFRC